MSILIKGLLAGGVLLLVAALHPVRRIILQLPKGHVRRLWLILTVMIAFFIGGYLLFTVAVWATEPSFYMLVVALVFFFGACFVWLVNTLSYQTAVDIRRIATLEQETITDSLAGIFNRRYFDRRLKEETARALRYGLPLSLLLLDIDHFKSINDKQGHLSGDYILGLISKFVLNSTRPSDIVARYGGDEIAIVATNTPGRSARKLAERIRSAVESLAVQLPHAPTASPAIRPTVSVGVSSLAETISDATRLVACADEALYRAKAEGRNRVASYEPRP